MIRVNGNIYCRPISLCALISLDRGNTLFNYLFRNSSNYQENNSGIYFLYDFFLLEVSKWVWKKPNRESERLLTLREESRCNSCHLTALAQAPFKHSILGIKWYKSKFHLCSKLYKINDGYLLDWRSERKKCWNCSRSISCQEQKRVAFDLISRVNNQGSLLSFGTIVYKDTQSLRGTYFSFNRYHSRK